MSATSVILKVPHSNRRAWRARPGSKCLVNLVLVIFAVASLYPFFAMAFGAFKSPGELSINPGGIPVHPTVANFVTLFSDATGAEVWRSLLNSVIVTVPFTLITVLVCTMAGFAFTRYKFRGNKVLFALLVASMLVPVEVNIPSMYIGFAQIGWLNTYQVQILPGTASVLGMFLTRQYMAGLPGEVFEAARMDGAGHWRTFWRIALPMSTPVISAVAVFTFVTKWSDYLWPRIMVTDPNYQPIMALLPSVSTSATGNLISYQLLLAGALVVTIPLLIVFLRFQNQLMNGTTAGAVRG